MKKKIVINMTMSQMTAKNDYKTCKKIPKGFLKVWNPSLN